MGRNLLFVCKHPESEQEFLEALKDSDIEIDTASNGIEAAACVRKKEYQIVVTGLTMEGYNGEQIISYLNKHHPNTVCIIYTTTISPAQLHFFINERSVFRVFLRPVDYQKEFLPSLDAAYEHYDVRAAELREHSLESAKCEELRAETELMTQRLGNRDLLQKNMGRYMKRLMGHTIATYGKQLPEDTKKRIRGIEREIVDLCCEVEEEDAKLAKAEAALKNIRELAGASPQ